MSPSVVLISLLALLFSLLAFFLTLLLVLPPPLYWLWVASVAVTEWSFWFGALGLAGACFGIAAARSGATKAGWVAVILGVVALGLSFLPLLQSLPVAREQKVHLSLRTYLTENGASWGRDRFPPPETVTFATAGNQTLALDVYRPAPLPGHNALPAIIVVHGGSWRAGSKSDFPHWNRWLTSQGYVVFDIEYRLEPAPNWREAISDVKSAVGWVRANAHKYQVDPHRLALLGRSAGGHLALIAAYTANTADTPPSVPYADTSVKTVIAFYAPSDLVWGYDHPANPDVIDGPGVLRRFLGGNPRTAQAAYGAASPILHVHNGETPLTLLFHGGADRLVGAQHTRRLAAVLAEKGVPCASVIIPYAQHGFDYHLGGWGSQIARPAIARFLRAHL